MEFLKRLFGKPKTTTTTTPSKEKSNIGGGSIVKYKGDYYLVSAVLDGKAFIDISHKDRWREWENILRYCKKIPLEEVELIQK